MSTAKFQGEILAGVLGPELARSGDGIWSHMTLECLLSGLWLKPPSSPRPLILEARGLGGLPVKPSEPSALAQAVPSSGMTFLRLLKRSAHCSLSPATPRSDAVTDTLPSGRLSRGDQSHGLWSQRLELSRNVSGLGEEGPVHLTGTSSKTGCR